MQRILMVAGLLWLGMGPGTALARDPFSCAGAAMEGGAELLCSHIEPMAPTQTCNFSWTLMNSANHLAVVQGSFVLPRGTRDAIVFQGSGYRFALAMPVVLCQGRSDAPPG